MTVIDASVYVALINADAGEHARSWAWFQRARVSRQRIRAPAILVAEVAAALSRGADNPLLARRVVQQLVHANLIEFIPVTQAVAERAAAIAAGHRVRGCDAVYIAVAEQLGDDLITLDRQQLERGAAIVTTSRPLEAE